MRTISIRKKKKCPSLSYKSIEPGEDSWGIYNDGRGIYLTAIVGAAAGAAEILRGLKAPPDLVRM